MDGQPAKWSGQRIAWLGFLIGRGWDAKRIADDLMIHSTPNQIHIMAHRFGLAFKVGDAPGFLSPEASAVYAAAAQARGLTKNELIRKVVAIVGSDPTLLENIIDDG